MPPSRLTTALDADFDDEGESDEQLDADDLDDFDLDFDEDFEEYDEDENEDDNDEYPENDNVSFADEWDDDETDY
jgi:ribonuclease E